MTAGTALRAAALSACLVFSAGCEGESAAQPAGDLTLGEGFDFYVAALSWSPSYCAATGDGASDLQCGPDAPFGFIMHGLWPQFESGYPTDCDTQFGADVTNDLAASMLDIMPSWALVRHEWTKHGSCTGLSQADYFETTRRAFERIALPAFEEGSRSFDPDEVENMFRSANEGLPASAIAVTCDDRHVRDVRICLSRDLREFVSCPEVDRRSCRLPRALMPAAN